ncbi:MAG: hypothetical protein R3F45_10075 [Gammaproteobacteria bacterium]
MRLLFFLNRRTNFFLAMIQVSKIVSDTGSARRGSSHGIQLSLNAIQLECVRTLEQLRKHPSLPDARGIARVGMCVTDLLSTLAALAVDVAGAQADSDWPPGDVVAELPLRSSADLGIRQRR